MDSHRVEKKAAMKIALPNENVAIGPILSSCGGRLAHPFRPEAQIHPHFVKAIGIRSKIIH